MNPTEIREILGRAADAVAPAETDPVSRMVSLGRRSVRLRRAWGACVVAVAVAAVVTLPLAIAGPGRSDLAGPGTTVAFGGLTVAVPEGWRTSQVPTFTPCTAEPRTVYLAERWDLGFGAMPSTGPDAGKPVVCPSEDQEWMAVVQEGTGRSVSPSLLVVENETLLQLDQWDPRTYPSMWAYRAYNGEIRGTTAFISGDQERRGKLLKGITWPANPPPPPTGGLALPDRIKDVLTDAPPSNAMVVASDTETLTLIRQKLAALRDPVPAGAECPLQKPGSVGISLGDINVVLGDATCPQAVSTGGGRVQAPAGLGKELLDLIVASSRGPKD